MPTVEEVIDTTQMADTDDSEHSDAKPDEVEPELDGTQPGGSSMSGPSASTSTSTSTSKKKKKSKGKSKAAKALAALKGKDKDGVPQAVVDKVLEKVKAEHGEHAEGADEESVRKALEVLKIKEVMKGKVGLGGHGSKDMGEHKVIDIHHPSI